MKRCSLAVLALLAGAWCFAGPGPVLILKDGTVRIAKNDTVLLGDESVAIRLKGEQCTVEVLSTFTNEGGEQTVFMGFPRKSGWYSRAGDFRGVEAFKAFEEGVPLKVFETTSADGAAYVCFAVTFKKGETKTIRNTYIQTLFNHEIGYPLSKSVLWKGNINSVNMTVVCEGLALCELTPRVYFKTRQDVALGGTILPVLTVYPEKYTLAGNTLSMGFREVEPFFNLEFRLPTPVAWRVEASSSPRGKDAAHAARKACDADSATCWSEGKNGDGVGETLRVVLEENTLVEKVGIINGWAKDDATFAENSRVRKISVSSSYYMLDSGEYHSPVTTEVFELADVPDLQFLTFARPVRAGTMTFKILEVYRGTKNQDTCLSEVILYPYDPAAQ